MHWSVQFTWVLLSVVLTIALGFALYKIRYFTKVLSTEGIQSSHRLMVAHQLSFAIGTIFSIAIFVAETIEGSAKIANDSPA